MSFAQGAPTQPLVLQGSNVFLYGSSTSGNAFTVQQLSAGNVASFVTSTGATGLIVNPTGLVGIGKTNPAYALDVTGDLNFTGTFRQNGTPYIGSQWTGTTTLYFVGNVGIGTNNPQYLLHVTGAAASTVSNIVVEAGTNAIGQRSEIRFGIPAFSGTGKRAGITSNTYVSDGSDLQFWTNASGGTLSSPQMTILPSGNVGIGIASPTAQLHVYQSNPTGYQLSVNNIANAGGSNYSSFIHSDQAYCGGVGGVGQYTYSGASLLVTSYPNNTSNNSGYTAYFGTSDNAAGSLAPQMVIKSATGNVGIGTASPGVILDVYQSLNAGNTVRAYNPNTGTSAYGGFIMGTNDSTNRGGIITFNSTYTASAQYRTSGVYVYCNGSGGVTLHAEGGNNLYFATNSVERMRIDSSGLVGIGTVTPVAKLTVAVSGNAETMYTAAWSDKYFSVGQAPTTTSNCVSIGFDNGGTGGWIYSLAPSTAWRTLNYGALSHSFYCAGTTAMATFTSSSVSTTTSYVRTPGSGNAAFSADGTGLGATGYNYVLAGGNDTGNKLVVFINGSTRSADGGVSNVTIRNDVGSVILGSSAYPNIILGSFVGIGTSSNFNAAFKHFVYGGDGSFTLYGPNASWGAYLNVGAGNTYCGAGRASVVASNGNLHIDCATGGYQIYLNYFQGGGSGGTNATVGCYAAFTATGDITAFSSDERLKTKVGLIENPLDKVCSLTAFKYIHNETARKNGFTDDNVYVGLSAQEVQKVLPEVVKPAPFDQGTEYDVGKGKSKSGENYLTIQYERIVSLLVEAVKEERAERLKVDESLRTTNERLARLEKLLLKE